MGSDVGGCGGRVPRDEQLAGGERDSAFRELMRFEVERTRGFYEAAKPLVGGGLPVL